MKKVHPVSILMVLYCELIHKKHQVHNNKHIFLWMIFLSRSIIQFYIECPLCAPDSRSARKETIGGGESAHADHAATTQPGKTCPLVAFWSLLLRWMSGSDESELCVVFWCIDSFIWMGIKTWFYKKRLNWRQGKIKSFPKAKSQSWAILQFCEECTVAPSFHEIIRKYR